MHDLIGGQITGSAIIVYLLQVLKNWRWFSWLDATTDRRNRIVAIALAGLTALGIHAQFDATGGVLTITGLTLAGIADGLWDWIRSFVIQELIYRGVIKNGGAGAKP